MSFNTRCGTLIDLEQNDDITNLAFKTMTPLVVLCTVALLFSGAHSLSNRNLGIDNLDKSSFRTKVNWKQYSPQENDVYANRLRQLNSEYYQPHDTHWMIDDDETDSYELRFVDDDDEFQIDSYVLERFDDDDLFPIFEEETDVDADEESLDFVDMPTGLSEDNFKMCTLNYSPVCGSDGKTYSNSCFANINNVMIKHNGACNSASLADDDEIACFHIFQPVCGENGKTYSNSCQARKNKVQIKHNGACKTCICTKEYNPVCGEDNKTYSNKCHAECAQTTVKYVGQCK